MRIEQDAEIGHCGVLLPQFVDRERELRQLEHYLDQLRRGQPTHVALFGLRRIGKSLFLKELITRLLEQGDDVVPVYMDLSEACGSPEHFASTYIGLTAYWFLTRGRDLPLPFYDLWTSIPFHMRDRRIHMT